MTGIPLNPFSVTVLFILLSIAAWSDVRDRRIPNGLVGHGMLLALAMAGISAGANGLVTAGAGLIIAGGMLLPFYAAGGMGAGDVKLAAMCGAFLGAEIGAVAVAMTLVAGVALAAAYLVAWRIEAAAWRAAQPREMHPLPGPRPNRDHAFPYALAIAAGTLGAVVWALRQPLSVVAG